MLNYPLLCFIQEQVSHDQAQGWLSHVGAAEILAVIAIMIGVATLVFALLGWDLRSWRKEKWLKKNFGCELYTPEEIRALARHYIRPHSTNFDPAAQETHESTNHFMTREDLFGVIDRFLGEKSECHHMLLLAGSGMGKSSFVANFYYYNQQKWGRKHRLAVIPLAHPKALEKINGIGNKNETVIFLDAFDEDPNASPTQFWKQLDYLLVTCSEFKRVLITCRSQFFPNDDAIPVKTRLPRVLPRSGDAHHSFCRLYLVPLSDDQVDEYLCRRYPFWDLRRRQARELAKKIPELTVRPMLLSYIPDILRAGTPIKTKWQLYEFMTRNWYEREAASWETMAAIERFSEEIAVRLYLNFLKDNADRLPSADAKKLFKALTKPNSQWRATSRSLLHRDALGNLKFAHPSIMEYLFIKKFIGRDDRCRDLQWTEQMKRFVVDICSFPESTIPHLVSAKMNGIDLSGADLSGANLSGTDLSGVVLNRANLSGTDFRDANLTGASLNSAKLTGSDLSGASLDGAKFSEANLSEAFLANATLVDTGFCGAYLVSADLRAADLNRADFSRASLMRANLTAARNLSEANFDGANLNDAIMAETKPRKKVHFVKLSQANRTPNPAHAGIDGASANGPILDEVNL